MRENALSQADVHMKFLNKPNLEANVFRAFTFFEESLRDFGVLDAML